MFLTPAEKEEQKKIIQQYSIQARRTNWIWSACLFLSCFSLLSCAKQFQELKENQKKQEASVLDYVGLGLFALVHSFVCNIALSNVVKRFKFLRLIKFSQTGRQSVSDRILNQLSYGMPQEGSFTFSSLTPSDLKKFCRFFDFSRLPNDAQKESLQALVDISEKEPFLRSFIRTPLPYTFGHFYGAEKLRKGVQGLAFPLFAQQPGCVAEVVLKEAVTQDMRTFVHEVRHAQQFKEGLCEESEQQVYFFSHVLSEAETAGYNAVLGIHQSQAKVETTISSTCAERLLTLFTRKNEQKLLQDASLRHQLGLDDQMLKQQEACLAVATRALAFENVVGVVMRLYLDYSEKERACFYDSLIKEAVQEKWLLPSECHHEEINADLRSIQNAAFQWRSAYITSHANYVQVAFNPLTEKQNKQVQRYLDYYTKKTGIKQSSKRLLGGGPEMAALKELMSLFNKSEVPFLSLNNKNWVR